MISPLVARLILLGMLLSINGTLGASTQPVSALAQSERQSILNGGQSHVASWAYFTDPTSFRWYIAEAQSGRKVSLFSLGSMVSNRAGWWTIGETAGAVNLSSFQVSADPNLDVDPSDTFFDAGLQQSVANPAIHADRQRIQGSTVPIKWLFFQAPNGLWYIVNAAGYGSSTSILKFASRNGQYDWQETDTADLNAVFTRSGSTIGVAFTSDTSSEPCPAAVQQLVQEYVTYGSSIRPGCSDFADSGGSQHFTWLELNGGFATGNPHNPWGMLKPSVTTGLEAIRAQWGVHYPSRPGILVTSGYRCPHGNAQLPNASVDSKHTHGIAADIYSAYYGTSSTVSQCDELRNVAWTASPPPKSMLSCTTYSDRHLHVQW